MRSLLRSALLLLPLLTGCIAADPDAVEQDAVESDADGVTSCADGPTVKGVDVSYFQGAINWGQVKGSGVKFGIARVADGSGFVDPRFAQNWKNMKSAGVVRGAYQFFRPDESASTQAQVFLDQLEEAGGIDPGDLPPTLDVEVTEGVSDGTIVSKMHTWITKVKEATGRTPMIYTSPGFWSQLGNPKGFGENPLWVAHWGVSCPSVPATSWNKWAFWQKSDSGSVPGISGAVDVDAFNGSLQALLDFATPGKGGAPMVSSWAQGRLDVFARDANDKLVHRWYKDGAWHGWESLGGNLTSDPAVVSWADGRIDVFARGSTKNLVHKYFVTGKGWSSWENLGGTLASTPAVSSWASGRLDVFARANGDDLVHRSFVKGQGWSTWENLGGALASRPAAVSWGEGRIDVFARGGGSQLLHRSYEEGSGWSAWANRGGVLTSAPTVASWDTGRLDVFARGEDDHLIHAWHTTDGVWHDFKVMAGSLRSAPAAVSWAPGRIDVFARDEGDRLIHRYFKTSDGWHPWKSMGAMP